MSYQLYEDISDEEKEFIDSLGVAKFYKKANENPDRCIICNEPFTDKNVFTPSGWKETKISCICEKCFDKMFSHE